MKKHLLLLTLACITAISIVCKEDPKITRDQIYALVDNGMFRKALPKLDSLYKVRPDDPTVLRYYGFALRAAADSNETPDHACKRMKYATKIWKEWLSKEESTEGFISLGSWYSWIGEYDSSLVYLKKSISFEPRGKRYLPGDEENRIAQTFFLAKEHDSVAVYLKLAQEKGFPVSEPKLIPNPCKLAELLAIQDSINQLKQENQDSIEVDSTNNKKILPVDIK